jgi:hypothetical protein
MNLAVLNKTYWMILTQLWTKSDFFVDFIETII